MARARLEAVVPLGTAIFTLVTSLGPYGFSQAQVSLTSSQEKQFVAEFTPAGNSFPVVSQGYILSHRRHVKAGMKQAIFLTALTSGEKLTLPFMIEGASVVRIETGVVTQKKTILIVGSYIKSVRSDDIVNFLQSPAYTGASNFVSEIDFSGKQVNLTDTGVYTPERVCSSPDGSFWTFGQIWGIENQRYGNVKPPVNSQEMTVAGSSSKNTNGSKMFESTDYAMIRHYDAKSELVASYANRTAIAASDVIRNFRVKDLTSSTAFMGCGDSLVVAYVAGDNRDFSWIRIDTKTGTTQNSKVHNPLGGSPTGFAFTNNTLYATFQSPRTVLQQAGTDTSTSSTLRPTQGMYQLSALDGTPHWVALNPQDPNKLASNLLGYDGSYLLHLEQSGARLGSTVFWSKPTN